MDTKTVWTADTGIGPSGIYEGTSAKREWIEDFINGPGLLDNNITNGKIIGIIANLTVNGCPQRTKGILLSKIGYPVIGRMAGNDEMALRGY